MSLTLRKKTDILKEKRGKIARRNRRKGKRGEALIYHMLSDWFGIPESFSSNAGSGGAVRFGQAGDINVPTGFKLVFEVKNSEAWELGQMLTNKKPTKKNPSNKTIFWSYYEQLIKATKDYNDRFDQLKNKANYVYRFSILIFTKNYEEIFCLIPFDTQINLNIKLPMDYLTLHKQDEGSFYICLFNDFLNNNESKKFI